MSTPKIVRSLKAALAAPTTTQRLALSVASRRAPLTELAALPALETLTLHAPHARFDLAGTIDAAAQCPRLREFGLFDGEVPTLPPDIASLRSVARIDVWNCGLTAWPEALAAMPALEAFMVLRHTLTRVPDVVGELPGLLHLALMQGTLAEVSPRIAACARLGSLYLSRNQLASLPDALAGHPSLAFVNLDGNPGLTALPPWFAQLPSLSYLHMPATAGRALRASLRAADRTVYVRLHDEQPPYEELPDEG